MKEYVYREGFEKGELKAWASYPPCQDTAYDPFLYPGKIRPDDEGTCLVAVKYPSWNEDQLIGAVRLFDLILDCDCSIGFRYYIKTVDYCPELKVHLPLATGERPVYTVKDPPVNRWNELNIDWTEIKAQNEFLFSVESIRITAVAIQVRVSNADTDMPVFFGLDDVIIRAKSDPSFVFTVPEVAVLSEWPERIPLKHYRPCDELVLEGMFDTDISPDTVRVEITSFTRRDTAIWNGELYRVEDNTWKSDAVKLDGEHFPAGLYRGEITAESGGKFQSVTLFTIFVAAEDIGGKHPRLLFDDKTIETMRERINSKRFGKFRRDFVKRAELYREKLDPHSFLYDIDQFPKKDWIATVWNWFIDRIMISREALYHNSVVYSLLDDREAGQYSHDLILVLARWPQWNHPWMENRGFHTYFPLGELSDACAFAYDLIYNLLTDEERCVVREGLNRNFFRPAFETYVAQNQITNNTSNWLSHIAGGAIISLSSMYRDGPEPSDLEPWLTGFILKEYKYINTVFGCDGSYGEGYRYYSFAMQSLARAIPVLERVFGIDFSAPVHNSYLETLWAGIIRKNAAFTFGDSESYLKEEAQASWIGSENGPMNSWAWLLARTRDELLSWLYHQLKDFDTLQEVLHETDDIPCIEPDGLGDVKFFREVGTAVFKSGWGTDDFVFVFRCGPFYNHQHCDQGSFYFADYGRIFLEERYDGEHHYYDDPLYQSHAIQAISHNTILLNRNPQSQKVGDPVKFAPGMNDQAVFAGWLDTELFAYASGELERVYVEKVKALRRHVLYIKPRSILLVDEIIPDGIDVEISELFHTKWEKDISLHDSYVSFHKGGPVLYLYHLAPSDIEREIITEPHFKCQYNTLSLIKRGYLQLSKSTGGKRLIMANLLTATDDGSLPDVTVFPRADSVFGNVSADGLNSIFAVNTAGKIIELGGYSSDALFIACDDEVSKVFIASGTTLELMGRVILRSKKPITAYYSLSGKRHRIAFYLSESTDVFFGVVRKPDIVTLSGELIKDFSFDASGSQITLTLPPGEGIVEIDRE